MEQICGCCHRYENEDDRQKQNWAEVSSKVSPGCPERSGIDQRRKEQIKNELGLEPNCGKTRNQSEQDAAKNEENWIRDTNSSSDEGKQRDRDQRNQD